MNDNNMHFTLCLFLCPKQHTKDEKYLAWTEKGFFSALTAWLQSHQVIMA